MTDEDAIRDVVATWLAATRRGDIDTVLSLMTDDVVFLVPGRPPMRKAEFEAASRAHAASGAPAFDGTSDIQEIHVSGDWAWMWNHLTIVATPPGGKAVTRAGYTLTIFTKRHGRWLLTRDANMVATVSG
jgi:uncharacterized protein (TIGR02246 family)